MSHYFSKQEDAELVGYYHIARTALSHKKSSVTRHDRLSYAAEMFSKKNKSTTKTQAYLRVDNLTRL
jgi:hypothetical protein